MKILFSFSKVLLGLGLLFGIKANNLYAQSEAPDTLWVVHQDKEIFFRHTIKEGETIFMLAKRFHVPVSDLAAINHLDYSGVSSPGRELKIPIGKYNYLRINSVVNSKPIYYQVQQGERLRKIARYFNVSQSSIQRWNQLSFPEVFSGQTLQVGWVQFDAEQKPVALKNETATRNIELNKITRKNAVKEQNNSSNSINETTADQNDTDDTTAIDPWDFAQQFQRNNEGKELQEASGAAVFFTTQTPDDNKVFYAFYNDAPRGTILSIYNPASRRAVYAKVIGSLPKIGKYHNALIGLSINAAKELQGIGSRVFVKIKY